MRRELEPCVYLGDPLTVEELRERGMKVDHRRWSFCEHRKLPLGGVVCPCRGCGPKCREYSMESVVPETGK